MAYKYTPSKELETLRAMRGNKAVRTVARPSLSDIDSYLAKRETPKEMQPKDIADKLHLLPDGSIDLRLVNLDVEEFIDKVVDKIRSKKLLDIVDINNSNVFTFNKKQYKVSEMMHGGGGQGSLQIISATGTVNGVNTSFTFSTAPQVIVVDQGRAMQKTNSDGSTNWTGTTSVTLAVAPVFDIYGY